MCVFVTRFVFPTGLFALGMSSSRSARRNAITGAAARSAKSAWCVSCVCATRTRLHRRYYYQKCILALVFCSLLPIKVMMIRRGMSPLSMRAAAITCCGFHRLNCQLAIGQKNISAMV